MIDWVQAAGINTAKGKILIGLPDKSLCLLGCGLIEH